MSGTAMFHEGLISSPEKLTVRAHRRSKGTSHPRVFPNHNIQEQINRFLYDTNFTDRFREIAK